MIKLLVTISLAFLVNTNPALAVTLHADAIYHNANIYTMNADSPKANYLAIKAGKILAVGEEPQKAKYIGPNTELINLRGKAVIPGIHDAHTHLLASQLKFGNFNCELPTEQASSSDIVASLERCQSSDVARPGNWLIGGYISNSLLKSSEMRRKLNEAFPEVPVLFSDFSNHNVLVNKKALELAGVEGSTKAPKGGIIARDENGKPNGLLVETAVRLVYRAIPEYDELDYLFAVKRAVDISNRYGITSVQEASAVPGFVRALEQLEQMGELSLHVAAHIVIDNEKFVPNESGSTLFDERARYSTTHIDVDNAKFWLDGQPLNPFPTHAGIDHLTGEIDTKYLLFEQNYLNKKVLELDREGVKVKLHAVGQGAVRSALDAVEYARERNDSGINHDIAHCNFIHPRDISRFAELNVTAELSPAIWHMNIPELDDASSFRALIESGANVTIGSDWLLPKTPNLFPALQGIVANRKIPMEDLLPLITINGAYSVDKEKLIGSIEPGKSADFVVLDRDVTRVPVDDIKSTKVLKTVFEGRTVYEY